MRMPIVLFALLLSAAAGSGQPSPVGLWTFDNGSALTAASVGSDLSLVGSHAGVVGPDTGDGAVVIGVGSYYVVPHGIAANGGGSMVNQWSLLVDFRVGSLGSWRCFYQTDATNGSDGDCFINPSGQIGVGATGYSGAAVSAARWYRLAIVVDNGVRYEAYLDGSRVLNGSAGPVDGRFALAPSLLLFADNDGEDNDISVAQVRLYSTALSAAEVSALGAVSVGVTPPDTTVTNVSGWPTYRHDPRRSALSTESPALPLHLQWVYRARHAPSPAWPPPANVDIFHGVSSIPAQMAFDRSYYVVSADGRAFFGASSDHKVYCLDAATGQELWTFFAEAPVRFAPTVSGSRVLFGSDDGYVYCVEAATGWQLWRYRAAPADRRIPGNHRMISAVPVRTDVIVNNGAAVFGAGIAPNTGGMGCRRVSLAVADGRVNSNVTESSLSLQGHMALESGGSTLWPQGPGGRPFTPGPTLHFEYDGAAITVGGVSFAGGSGTVSGGTWSAAVKGKALSLAYADGRLFASTDSGYIYCFAAGSVAAADTVTPATSASLFDDAPGRAQYANAAQAILATSGVDRGYCLVLESGSGQLAYELATRSNLTIVCVEPDSLSAAQSRIALDNAGVYGQVAVHWVTAASLPYSDATFNVVTCDGYATGAGYSGPRAEVERVLRPYGGMAFLGTGAGDILSRGAIPNAGEWTHFYANVQNTANSNDAFVGSDVVMQWFGDPGPDNQIDRDFKGVAPLWKDGVLVVPGLNYVTAVDAYNGALLWERSIPRTSRMPGFRDASQIAVQSDFLYVAAADKCLQIDLRQGTQQAALNYPSVAGPRYAWAYVAVVGDVLLGSVEDTTVVRDLAGGRSFENNEIWAKQPPWPVSEHLFGLNRYTGAELWRYTPSGVVVNATIAVDNGRMIFLESTNTSLRAPINNRFPLTDLLGNGAADLVAIDIANGAVVWRRTVDLRHVTDLVYLSCPSGRILLTGVYYASDMTLVYDLYGFSQADGGQSWKTTVATGSTDILHGAERGHPAIVNNVAYFVCGPSVYFAVDVTNGQRQTWSFNRSGHGCGTASASSTHLFFRGGNPIAWDIAQGAAHRLTTVSRPGCFVNVVPAGALINIPESSSGCTCGGYPLQTSMALRSTRPLDTPTARRAAATGFRAVPPALYLVRTPTALVVTASGVAPNTRLKLSIVTLSGREVYRGRALSQGPAISHTFLWDCSHTASGAYVIRLQAGSERIERSITLVE